MDTNTLRTSIFPSSIHHMEKFGTMTTSALKKNPTTNMTAFVNITNVETEFSIDLVADTDIVDLIFLQKPTKKHSIAMSIRSA